MDIVRKRGKCGLRHVSVLFGRYRGFDAAALSDPDFAGALRTQIPMHRFGTAEECGELIAFLASDAAGYITGAEIPIAGGWQL